MGKIIVNKKEYGSTNTQNNVFISNRTICDEDGKELENEYIKGSNSGVLTPSGLFVNEQMNAGFHNSFYIEQYITDLDSMYTNIANGTFEGLFVGSKFTVNNHKYIIAGFDIYLNNGNTAFTNHHAVCVPSFEYGDSLYTGKKYNSTNTISGGFVNTEMFKTHIPAINTRLTEDFGSHLATHRESLSSEVNASVASGPNPYKSGASSNWTWQSVQSCLMTELEINGTTLGISSGYDIGTGKVQLPLFRYNTSLRERAGATRCVANSTSVVLFCWGGIQPMSVSSNSNWMVSFCII